MMPETRYATVGDVHVAYQTVGDGPIDLVLADQWFSHMEAQWDVPPVAEFRRRLASIGRLIVFDKRGVGMSDPVAIDSLPSIEAWMDDLRAVLDAVGCWARRPIAPRRDSDGLLFAAAHPDRVRALVIAGGSPAHSPPPTIQPAGRRGDRAAHRPGRSQGRGLMASRPA
jgi:pimeloyl-ACP methyl ester carboxylesterase